MRVGGDSRGLVGVSLPFSFPYLCFSFWLAGCIPLVYLSVASGLFCFGFNNILSFTHQKKKKILSQN